MSIFGGIMDPSQWKPEVTIVDKNRGLTYLTKKYKKADYSLVKLHEIQKKYDEKCTNDESLAKIFKSPTEQVDDMLQTEWPLNEKKRKARLEHLNEGCDDYPMHIILVDDEIMKSSFKLHYFQEVKPLCHVKLCKIVGNPNMCFLSELIVRPELRGQGFGKFFYHSLESFLKDITTTDELGISCTGNMASFFSNLGFNKNPGNEAIPYIDVKESALLAKVNDFFALAKDAMHRDGEDSRFWLRKDLINFKAMGTPVFKRAQSEKRRMQQLRDEEIERKTPKSAHKKIIPTTGGHMGVSETAKNYK